MYKTVLYLTKAFVVEMFCTIAIYCATWNARHHYASQLLHCYTVKAVCYLFLCVSSFCLISITLPPMCVCVGGGGGFVYPRNLGAAQKIEAEIRERKVSKEYVCRVVGEFPE